MMHLATCDYMFALILDTLHYQVRVQGDYISSELSIYQPTEIYLDY